MIETSPARQSRRSAEAYLRRFRQILDEIDIEAVARVAHRLHAACARGATIYVAGNGGSAATASHFVNDLGKATKLPGHLPMRAMSLTDNTSWLSALANDEGYDRVFAGQLENFARPGDVLVVISASGNSANLIRAVELAREREMETIGLLGFDGGVLKDRVDAYVWVPTEWGAYGPVEDSHSMLCHTLAACLRESAAATEAD
jgi:D-sedoheptulose 7-phosphate isomerase